MSEGKVEVEISTDLYEKAKQVIEESGHYESVDELAAEAIRWTLENYRSSMRRRL